MSEERDQHEEQPEDGEREASDAGAGPETGESGGLGLTEQFARIEEEIRSDLGREQAEDVPSGEEVPADEEPVAGEESDAGESIAAEATPDEADGDETVQDEPGDDADAGDEAGEEGASEGEVAAEDAVETPIPEPERPTEVVRPKPQAPRPSALPSGVRPPVVKPMPRPVVAGTGVPVATEPEQRTPSLMLRFLAGSMLVIASVAAAVSVSGLLFLSDVAARLQPIPGIQGQLSEVESNAPQTIMLIGSDKRASDPDERKGLSDTTMLLRVDPEKEVLSLFSLPRDLKVSIPGVGVSKLNEAYAAGGAKKTLRTVKRFTGLDINHVVEINFAGFAEAVNAIGCVYIDVDRDYFHSNEGLPPELQFSEIDINSGYQRLCGLKALQYVRFRHTDTDIVRAARQQDFLREARQKVQPRELIPVIGAGTGNDLIDIFTSYTESDISDEADVIGILKSFVAVRNVPVNEVHFEGDIGGPDSTFVTATDEQVSTAIDQFLNGVGTEGLRGGQGANKKGAQRKAEERKAKKKKADVPAADVVEAEPQFAKYGGTADRRLNFPIFAPTQVVPGSTFSRDSRTYEYNNDDDRREAAYKIVIALSSPSTLIEYYGVMGTTWEDPPILRNPSERREIDGREYLLFYDGGRLRMVGWQEKGSSYWVNNTLVQSIGEAEMLAIATSMRKA